MVLDPQIKTRVCGLAIREQSILLIRYDYPDEPPLWHIPGGGAEPGELLSDAVEREFQEELGIPVAATVLSFVCNSVRTNDHGLVYHCVFDVASLTHAEPALQPENTFGQHVEWVPIADLSAMRLYPNIGDSICQWVHRRRYFDGTQNLGYIIDPYAIGEAELL